MQTAASYGAQQTGFWFNFLQEDDDIGFSADKGTKISILPIN
jgi:hypothetical protein